MALKDPHGPSGTRTLAVLAVSCLALMTLDAQLGKSSPMEPVRGAVGTVMSPVEDSAAFAVRPVVTAVRGFSTNRDLREQVATLSAQNSQLRSDLVAQPLDRKRLEQLEGLMKTSADTGYSLKSARVIAVGSMQSFSRTVTIDAGTSDGVQSNSTVLNNDGLVGRVVRTTANSATVLLITDPSSVVGGRLGSNLEIGSVRGKGQVGGQSRLELNLMSGRATPSDGDDVVTWGSEGGRPFVSGIPIGKVASVQSSPRQMAKSAKLTPFVDFTSLDVVGVVVPKGAAEHGSVITPKMKGKRQ